MTIRLAVHEARVLESYCRRQLGWDASALARVVTASSAVGVFTTPPMGVLAFAAVPTTAPVSTDEAVDATVPLDVLADRLRDVSDSGVDLSGLPLANPAPGAMPSLGHLPPRDGWQPPITGVSSDQVPMIDAAGREFEERAAGLGARQQEQVADEIWDRTGFGGLPVRALHSARRLGLLADDSSRIATSTNGPWKRLSTVRGQVFVYATGPRARLALHVVA